MFRSTECRFLTAQFLRLKWLLNNNLVGTEHLIAGDLTLLKWVHSHHKWQELSDELVTLAEVQLPSDRKRLPLNFPKMQLIRSCDVDFIFRRYSFYNNSSADLLTTNESAQISTNYKKTKSKLKQFIQ